MTTELLTLAQAAAVLGLSPSTLRTQVQRGRLAAQLAGKTYLVQRSEVERYQREQAGRPGPKGRNTK